MLKNSGLYYGSVAKSFHWIIAILIIGLLAVGMIMHEMDPSPLKFKIYGLHKATGITVLALAFLRLSWRMFTPRVEAMSSHEKWERVLAKVAHLLLCAAMFVMPLSGWVMSSAGGHPVMFFGLFEVPPIVGANKELGRLASEVHEISAYALIGLIALHILGAIKHHVLDEDSTLQRMTSKKLGKISGILIAVLAFCGLAVAVFASFVVG